MMSSSKRQVSNLNFTHKAFKNDHDTFCSLKAYTHHSWDPVYDSSLTWYSTLIFFMHMNLADLTILSTCFYHRLADGELAPYVLPTPPNDHHRSLHLLCDVTGASVNGEPQSFWPQRGPRSLQLRCGGALALHVLWSESFASHGAQQTIVDLFCTSISCFVELCL